jgi:hypothetical protein
MSEKTTSGAVSSLGPLRSILVADFSGEKRELIDGGIVFDDAPTHRRNNAFGGNERAIQLSVRFQYFTLLLL